jgi:uncharacterized protein (TIRG00374 family)
MTGRVYKIADKEISLLNIVYFIISVLLGAIALWYCFKNINFDEFIIQLYSVNFFYIGLSLVFGFAAFIFRAARWNILINTLGHRPSVYDTYNAIMIAYIANLAIPRIGEITRCAILYKTNKIPVNSLFGTVVTERIIDVLTLFVVMLWVFVIRMELFMQFVYERIVPIWKPIFDNLSVALTIIIAVVAVIVIFMIIIAVRRLLKRPSMIRVKTMLRGLSDGLKSVFRMRKKIHFVVYTIAIWTCYWLSSYLVILALPSTSMLCAADGLLLMVLGSLGWVVPVPGGFGTFHTLVAWGLMMYGITFEDGVIVATLSHETQLVIMVFFGLIALAYVSLSRNKLNKYE